MHRFYLSLLLAAAACAQDLPVIHIPPEAARILSQAYRNKVEAARTYAELERQAVLAFVTRPGGGQAGAVRAVTADPLPGWEYGALFADDFSAMVPRPKPAAAALPACPESGSRSIEVDTIPATPWLPR